MAFFQPLLTNHLGVSKNIGIPPNHPFLAGSFPSKNKPSSYWGSACMETAKIVVLSFLLYKNISHQKKLRSSIQDLLAEIPFTILSFCLSGVSTTYIFPTLLLMLLSSNGHIFAWVEVASRNYPGAFRVRHVHLNFIEVSSITSCQLLQLLSHWFSLVSGACVVAQEHIEKAKKLETMLWLERWCEGTFPIIPHFLNGH